MSGPVARRPVPWPRLGLGALGMAALLAGLWAALLLLGLHVPTPRPDFTEIHGPLMVLGFLGTLISLERAVAVDVPAGYLAPAATGVGALALLLGAPLAVGQALLTVGGLGLVGLYAIAARRQSAFHLWVMSVGAVAWVVAATLWLAGWDVARLVPWLAGFLVLTIADERLELSRLVGFTRTSRVSFGAAAVLFAAGMVTSLTSVGWGIRLAGAGLVALAGWLAVYDVARRTVRQFGLTRYMAVCLLTGYAWLAVAGGLWLTVGTVDDGAAFDAMLHALFLGFVIGMVLAHAPVIVPAVFRATVPYQRHFYGPLVLLDASLLLRVVGGDLAGNRIAWQVGGVLNEVALLCFLAVTIHAVRAGRRRLAAPAFPRTQHRDLTAGPVAKGAQS